MTTKTVCLLGLVAIFGTATGYVMSRRINAGFNNSPQNAAIRLSREKVNRNLLPSQLRWALKELGDRLERPGKERRTMVAEWQRGASSTSFQLVLEFPDRLRLAVLDGSSARVVTFDGNEARALGSPPDTRERELIESLVFDSAEHFFISQTRGAAIRAIGNRFRSDDGSYRDIYELTDSINVGTAPRVKSKLFYFNSDTQLLEKVRYAIERDGGTIQVETHFAGWQTSQQQKLSGRITRLENGNTVWILSVTSVVLSPMLDDNMFSTP